MTRCAEAARGAEPSGSVHAVPARGAGAEPTPRSVNRTMDPAEKGGKRNCTAETPECAAPKQCYPQQSRPTRQKHDAAIPASARAAAKSRRNCADLSLSCQPSLSNWKQLAMLAVVIGGTSVPASVTAHGTNGKPVALAKIPAPARKTILQEAQGTPILKVEEEVERKRVLYDAHVKKAGQEIGHRRRRARYIDRDV